MIYELKNKTFWIDEAVENLLEYMKEQKMDTDGLITCAAGMTPSCPIHFGILREIAVSSFIADELRSRGYRVRLVYYWDDYDHFCKIPFYTTKEAVEPYLGKTLREVPDFSGNYNSYGEHYMHSFELCLHRCGFIPDYDYQSVKYTSGYYKKYIVHAIEKRFEIFDIINAAKKPYSKEVLEQREDFYPLEVYCAECGRDSAKTVSFDKETTTIKYVCQKCGHEGSYNIFSGFKGKLIWKANWALRWSDDCVNFESSGENQLTDTGSYSVATKIASEIFGGKTPFSLLYRFIGIPGVSKVSRALGKSALASRFCDVLEPPVIRWLLVKTPPNKPITIDIEAGIFRIYHEWDMFCNKIHSGEASDTEMRIWKIAANSVAISQTVIPFKIITTALTIANGDKKLASQLLYKITDFDGSVEDLKHRIAPRLEAAHNWLYKYNNVKNEAQLLTEFNQIAWDSLSENCRKTICIITRDIFNLKKESEINELLHNAPKQVLAENCDDSLPDEQALSALQKEVFVGIYRLLLGSDRGPKLATLLALLDKSIFRTLLRGAQYE